jgi:hypothetical protein
MIGRSWLGSGGVRWTRRRVILAAAAGAGVVLLLGLYLMGGSRVIVRPATDLSQVPEVDLSVNSFSGLTLPTVNDLTQAELEAPLAQALSHAVEVKKAKAAVGHINRLDQKARDGFVEALREKRGDLAGLAFAMGDACRMKEQRKQPFGEEIQLVHQAMLQVERSDRISAPNFWSAYRDQARPVASIPDYTSGARVAALMQILAPESAALRQGLVEYLAALGHAEATQALARLAVFSADEEVRQAALQALAGRKGNDCRDLLLQGMRYPWPAVAGYAAEALVKLDRKDLVPQLVDLLDEPDPRAPVLTEADGKQVPVVRELVRVNHHKNCLLCHPPSNPGDNVSDSLTAPIPLPSLPLPRPFDGYGRQRPADSILVRIDVTYLRPDFSQMQPVSNHGPWPSMQRFDYLVRTRPLTKAEAAAYREAYGKPADGQPSPYQEAALTALRGLTGKDVEPTAEAWRAVLGLPSSQRGLALAR